MADKIIESYRSILSPKVACARFYDAILYHSTHCGTLQGTARLYEIDNAGAQRASSRSTGADNDHGYHNGQVTHISFNTQTLHEHTVQHTNVDQSTTYEHTNKKHHELSLKVQECSPQLVSALNVVSIVEDIVHDTRNISADGITPHERSREMWTYEHLENEGTQGMAGYDILRTSDLNISIIITQPLTISGPQLSAWGNDLAGVGDRFEDIDFGTYASAIDFIVE